MSSNIPDKFDRANPQYLKVIRIEPDMKQYINVPFKGNELSSKTLTKLTLFIYLQEKFEEILNPSDTILQIKDLFDSLNHFKSLLKRLTTRDLSKDYLYAEELCKSWHTILDHLIEASLENRSQTYLNKLKRFIHIIHHYPDNEDHTLGYYLTELTGERWLPFPFITILYSLHETAILRGNNCTLTVWIKMIDDIIYT